MSYRKTTKIVVNVIHQIPVWGPRVPLLDGAIDIGIDRIKTRIQVSLTVYRQLLQIETNVPSILTGTPLSRELHNPNIDLVGQPAQCITNGPHLSLPLLKLSSKIV
ncbi:hypothetical protein D3C78_1375050 [compost metagenome]